MTTQVVMTVSECTLPENWDVPEVVGSDFFVQLIPFETPAKRSRCIRSAA